MTEANDDARRYLINVGGDWYLRDSAAHTSSAIQAGRYTAAEAVAITHPNGSGGSRDGMSYIHEDAVTDRDWLAYKALRAEAADLRAHIERLTDINAEQAATIARMMRKGAA